MRVSRCPRGTWTAPGQVALLVLLLLAHVEDHRRLVGAAVAGRVIERLLDLGGIELLDPARGPP